MRTRNAPAVKEKTLKAAAWRIQNCRSRRKENPSAQWRGMRPMNLFAQLLSQVPSGTAENSPRLQSWVVGQKRTKPRRGERKRAEDWCILSSLTGLVPYSCLTSAMNRWAIIGRPCGTAVRPSLAGSHFKRRQRSEPPNVGSYSS